jgi:uncharacterized protein with GYD domain
MSNGTQRPTGTGGGAPARLGLECESRGAMCRQAMAVAEVGATRDGGFIGDFSTEDTMPKYLIEASYTAEGLRGLQKDKASGRKQAVTKVVESLEGKVEALYFALGEHDVVMIVEMPDVASAAALALGVSSTGLVRTRTTALLTVEETDRALAKKLNYRAPGA